MCSYFGSSPHSHKVALGAVVTVGTITAGLTYLYRRRRANLPPTKWKCVGKITEISCFPIKSCGPVSCESIECNILGLQDGHLRDRVFMIVTLERQFVTARAHPKIVLIQPKVIGNRMILSAPGKPDIEINFDDFKNKTVAKASVWNNETDAVYVSDEVDEWLSDYVLGEREGLRLVYYPHNVPTIPVDKLSAKQFPNLTKDDVGCMHDTSSYMLMNKASIDELNTHLDEPVKALRFRPNFVVEGPAAYEEDKWKWVRIGNDVVLRNVRPCMRCVFTNINPVTGMRSSGFQPLKTLNSYRKIVSGEAPVFGSHLGLRSSGKVSVGDDVFVEA